MQRLTRSRERCNGTVEGGALHLFRRMKSLKTRRLKKKQKKPGDLKSTFNWQCMLVVIVIIYVFVFMDSLGQNLLSIPLGASVI